MNDPDKKKQENFKNGCIGCLSIVFLTALGFGACSVLAPKNQYNISCVNEKGSTEWEDGSIQELTSNLGTEVFVWKKDNKVVEKSLLRAGAEVNREIPAILNGENLVFSADSISYVVNTVTGKINITSTGNSPDGKYVMRMEGNCIGFK